MVETTVDHRTGKVTSKHDELTACRLVQPGSALARLLDTSPLTTSE